MQYYPKSAISVMMITAYIFEQMSLRFEEQWGSIVTDKRKDR